MISRAVGVIMDKKYELTDETIVVERPALHRIRALKDFGEVKKGDVWYGLV